MSTAMQVQAMAALLRQARVPAVVSTLLAATALALLVWPGTAWATAGALVSLLAGTGQAYFAVRIGFDRALLDGLLQAHPDAAPGPIDDALAALGLRATVPPTRGWPARWQGMRRLLRGQGACVLLQAAALLVALGVRHVA
ncbi:hypothetical protein [Stenotrophomonas sp.]|uniref:hypothetical protein n=1 Tax=Stenotrophomonas sp. TaxID=69392 RepID=UPI002FC7FE71